MCSLKRTERALTAMQRDEVGTVRRQGRWLAVIDADAARTRRRLRALEACRRQPTRATSTDGLAGLTTSERAVVDLVVRGATNREVATQLFLSPHT